MLSSLNHTSLMRFKSSILFSSPFQTFPFYLPLSLYRGFVECEKFLLDNSRHRSGARREIFLTKQLIFLIYIIRTWEIGCSSSFGWPFVQSSKEIRIRNYVMSTWKKKNVESSLWPMRQFDIALHLDISLSWVKIKKIQNFDKLLHIFYLHSLLLALIGGEKEKKNSLPSICQRRKFS